MDREKVISGLMMLADVKNDDTCEGLKCCKIAEDALELLKEQESIIESLKSDLHETLEVISGQLNVVRCKDCKHGEKCNSVYLCGKSRGFGIAHEPDWFCADGEHI